MKTSRKKMLLSSIAMLLVALVALGSATYAWFSISKTVTADNMVVKAISTAGLEISNTSATTGYDTTVSFGQSSSSNFQLKPVSWDGATATGFIPDGNIASPGGAFTGTFKAADAYNPATSGTPKMGHNNYFAVYDIWVRSAAEGSTRVGHDMEVKVKCTGDNDTFARARLIDPTAANSKNYADTAASNNSVVKAAGTAKSTYTTVAFDTAQTATSTDTTTTGKHFQLVVWFDGEDAQCVDTAKNQTATFTVEFTATDM